MKPKADKPKPTLARRKLGDDARDQADKSDPSLPTARPGSDHFRCGGRGSKL